MTANTSYASIALVSGKGGVGKTTIAANLAWLISTGPSQVLVIDLDFQNLGSTGLFASRFPLAKDNARELLRVRTSYSDLSRPPAVTAITDHLSFLPAAMLVDTLEERDAYLGTPDEIRTRLSGLLDALAEWYHVDCFVLDCHGGVDALSVAAAGMCDSTVVVTEADSVTFAGTLGLVDRFYEHYAQAARKPTIEYVVNRVPSKYKWKDLHRVYTYYINLRLGRFTPNETHPSFIPAEGYLADSFGEYPFQVELAPKALFTRKLELLTYRLLHGSHRNLLSTKITSRFGKSRKVKKVQRTVSSLEIRNLRTVVTAYALASVLLVGFLPIVALDALSDQVSWSYTAVLGVASIVVGLYFVLAAFRVLQYFRQKFLFQKALWKVLPANLRTFWRRMLLWKLRIFFYGSAVMPALIVLYGLGFGTFAIVLLLGGLT
jgi:cellulose biosynthesis protein BcsQ